MPSLLKGDFVGDLLLEGQGAGPEPTASAVVADLMDIARTQDSGFRIRDSGNLFQPSGASAAESRLPNSESRFYMRLQVMDKPGVVADISAILRDEAISIESLIQRGKPTLNPHGGWTVNSVPVVITTHDAGPAAMQRAAEKIARVETVVEKPCVMRIED